MAGRPRPPAGWPPRVLTRVAATERKRGEGGYVADFIGTLCTVTKDTFAGGVGQPMVLRPWQRLLLEYVFARSKDRRRRHRIALVGMPRKNGKSGLAAGVALEGLFELQGAEVYSCAGDRAQAGIVFRDARAMVEASADLRRACKVYRDAIEVPELGSVYRALSAEAYTKEGLNPSRIIFDEVHVQPNDELWNVMRQATGARDEPLIFAITTAGVRTDTTGQDSVCYRLFQYGQRVATGELDDSTFFMAWWGAPDGADHLEPAVWAAHNPAYGDLLDPEDLAASSRQSPENDFRTKRLNQWVASQTAWLPGGAFEKRRKPRPVPDAEEVVLAFDGSFSGDSTGLTVHALADLHIDVVESWERPPEAAEWQVDQAEVEQTIRDSFDRWQVRHLVYDPRIWHQLFQRLRDEGYPVEPMPQGVAMIHAAQRFYEDVVSGGLTHSGDPRLERHVGNAVVKPTPQGPRMQKETPGSKRWIDLAVCAVMGHTFAAALAEPDYDIAMTIY